MEHMTIRRAAALCGGQLCGTCDPETLIGKIVIDTRAVQNGDLFAAFRGERVDGHDFIPAAFDRGAACCIGERMPEGETRPVIVVPDVLTALEQITAGYRSDFDLPVVGITGSVGKTTAKEMVAAVLSQRYNTLRTEGNHNNQIGVPMTVSRIEPEHEAAVVEMGISGFGEMTELAAVARPTVAVFTVIGRAHLEFLHDLEGVFRAKTEMLAFLPPDGTVVANGDDAWLSKITCPQRVLLYGTGDNCDVRADEIELLPEGRTRCRIRYEDRVINADVPAFGRQMVYAALEGAAVGIVLGLSDREIEAGIASYRTVGRRNAVIDTGFVTLVDDCYNANPESMRCAVDSLAACTGRRVCLLADMLELGEDSPKLHQELGRYAAEKGIDLVAACGELGQNIAEGAGERGRWFASRDAMIEALPGLLKKGDRVLVKASLGMHMEHVAEAVKALEST